MTERVAKISTEIVQKILEESSDVQILSQCLGLSRYLKLFLKSSDLWEIFGEDGAKKVKRNFCMFAEELSHKEAVQLRDCLKEKVRENLSREDISFLQGFRLYVALSYLEYDDKFHKITVTLETKQVVFAKYLWENGINHKEYEYELVKACDVLKLL